MRVLVCGGRRFNNLAMVAATLDAINPSLIIHGGATGADALAERWAETYGVDSIIFPTAWDQGRSAGPRRNAVMLKEGQPDCVVAFPGGKGTADMVSKAKAAGIPVKEIT